jgi:hypothetical protein
MGIMCARTGWFGDSKAREIKAVSRILRFKKVLFFIWGTSAPVKSPGEQNACVGLVLKDMRDERPNARTQRSPENSEGLRVVQSPSLVFVDGYCLGLDSFYV